MRQPKTPFATRLSGDAKETELRIRSIFQWKKQRLPVWLFCSVVIVVFGCIVLVSCRTGLPAQSERLTAYEVLTLNTSDGRTLSVELDLLPTERDENYFSVNLIRILEGETLLQTIDPATLTGYEVDGLYVLHGYKLGEPDVRDFNFDGSQDFALLAVEMLAKNNPYLFFLWDEDLEEFTASFVMTGLPKLDEEKKQLVEQMTDGLHNYYVYQDGIPILKETLQFPESDDEVRIYEDELTGLTLDGIGTGDDSVTIQSHITSDFRECKTTMWVTLGSDVGVLPHTWSVRAYPCLTAARLTNPNQDSLVVQLADMTSTYGAETTYVFDVEDGQLVERLFFEGVSGSYIVEQGAAPLDTICLAQLVSKWFSPEFHTAIWDGTDFSINTDNYLLDNHPLKHYGAAGEQEELTLRLRISTATELLTCEEVQILRGEEIIQTIVPDKDEVFYGRSQVAMTPMQFDDVNFDGYLDFGILCDQSANAYHHWFVWDPERFNFRFFGTLGGELTVDDTVWQITETLDDGTVEHYGVSQTGKLGLLLRPEKEETHFEGQTAAFQSVLRQSSLVYDATDGNRERKIVYTVSGNTFAPAYFSVVDLEQDEVPELVLWMTIEGNPYVGYDVLRWEEGTVVSYSEVYRGLQGLKEDGTYSYSSGAFDHGVGLCAGFGEDGLNTTNLTWRSGEEYFVNNCPASENQFNSALAAQDEKPDAVWYEYTNENIRKLGGIIAAAVG